MKMRTFKLRPIAEFIRHGALQRVGWGALASIPGLALAGPTGENVVGGAAVIHRPSATQTQIDQSTTNAIVNWQSFSVDNDEYVVFNQPGANASILNRVVGSQQSQILGQMQANGRVFLVNPQGVLFAPGAKVDVGSLTATVMDITNENFMAGNYVFARPSDAPDGATVENAGDIKVGDGGYVVLAGDYVNNTGVISARLGKVVLAAGSQMTLDLSDDGLVSFAIDEATVSSLAGVNNSGEVFADGGQIIMTAKVANDLVATAVNNDGLLQAHRIVEDGGEIFLSASGGDIVHSGTIDVAATGDRSGGRAELIGDENVVLTAGSMINANGSGTGNGGVVDVIADGHMAFRPDAEITALAGNDGERGGQVELSGHSGIQVRGNLGLGKGGELIIDPAVVTLVSSAGTYGGSSTIGVTDFIEPQLDSGANVTVVASASIDASSSVNSVTANAGSGDLRFQISDGDGDINLAGLEINILGDFNATAGSTTGDVNLGKVSANNVVITAGSVAGDITLNTGGVTAASSNLQMTAADDITVGTGAMPGNLSLTGSFANIDIDAGGTVTVNGNISASGTNGDASVNIMANNIEANNVIVYGTSGADVTLTATNNISVNDVEAEIGASSYGGGNAVIDIMATNAVSARNLEAVGGASGGRGRVEVDANNISVNDVDAHSENTAGSARLDAVNNLTVNGKTSVKGQGESAGVFFTAGNKVVVKQSINMLLEGDSNGGVFIDGTNGVDVRGAINVAATESAGADIDLNAANGNVSTKGLKIVAADGTATIDIEANFNTGTVLVDGPVDVDGTQAIFRIDGRDITLKDSVDLTAPSFALLSAAAKRNITTIGKVKAIEGGGGTAVVSYDFGGNGVFGDHEVIAGDDAAATLNFGFGEVGATGNNTTLKGNVKVMSGGTAALLATAKTAVTVEKKVDVSGMSAGAFIGGVDSTGEPAGVTTKVDGDVNVTGKYIANLGIFGGNVTVNGDVDVVAAAADGMTSSPESPAFGSSFAANYTAWANNNLINAGSVRVRNTVGNASAVYLFGNNGVFGNNEIIGGPSGMGYGFVNKFLPSGQSESTSGDAPLGKSATFAGEFAVHGGQGGIINIEAFNAIRTTGNGLLYADQVGLTVHNNGTTVIDVDTKSPEIHLQNLGMTPNVVLDNRAFSGTSTINFDEDTVLKAASFFGTGWLVFNGPFTADNLAVTVTNGGAAFTAPVNITGRSPFLPSATDLELFQVMADRGLSPPTHGPDVIVFARDGIDIVEPFNIGGSSPFTKMFSNGPIDISGITTDASTLLAVFSPISADRPIFIESDPFNLAPGTSGLFGFPTIAGLPNNSGTTIVLGELLGPNNPVLSGEITIGSRGSVNIGSRNLFVIGRGAVNGEQSVITNGIFEIIGLPVDDFFEVPLVNEFGEETEGDEDDEESIAFGDGEGGDDDGGGVSEESSSSESLECS